MHNSKLLFLFLLICNFAVNSQIKIGDNPQNIDASSILELESTTRAFVINRVNTDEMNAIVPLEGAMVYNTDIQCLHYYDGQNWLNVCEALGLTIEANNTLPINPIPSPPDTLSTIYITSTNNNINLEVGQITGQNIKDGTIRRDDIGSSEINGTRHIQDRSIPVVKLIPGAINQILKTNAAGTDVVWAAPPFPLAFGKVNGNTFVKKYPAPPSTLIQVGGTFNFPSINFIPPRLSRDYTVQLTVIGDNRILLLNQTPNGFQVSIQDALGEPVTSDVEWYFTVFDN